MITAPVAQDHDDSQGQQPDLLLSYAQVLDSENTSDVVTFLHNHENNDALMDAALMLHQLFDPADSFEEQLTRMRATGVIRKVGI